MGYESKIIIGLKSELKDKEFNFVTVISTFDLCKIDFREFKDLLKTSPASKCYCYLGDRKITEDMYGKELQEFDLQRLIDALEAIEKKEHYRRIPPLLGMLKGFQSTKEDYKDLIILHFGY